MFCYVFLYTLIKYSYLVTLLERVRTGAVTYRLPSGYHRLLWYHLFSFN